MHKYLLKIVKTGVVFLVLVAISACANRTAVNNPIQQWTPQMRQQAIAGISGEERSPEILVMLAFSGGGTRAAAFSYGVLQELAATKIRTEKGTRSLLDEIDIISSVSGGSFTSAYYGLYGDRIFDDFEERFLRRNVEGALLWRLALPGNWLRLLSTKYGRIDLAAQYYNKHIFDGATFADLMRPNAPRLLINATDLASGTQFPFVPRYFNLLCSDLSSYPISRAVAASSAVPVLFSPITIENYAGGCDYIPPPWFEEALKDDSLTTRKIEAQNIKKLMDKGKRPWLHLVDGGISDNLGLRPFFNTVALVGDPHAAFSAMGHPRAKKIIIISVDSHAVKDAKWFMEQSAPSLSMIIGSISADQISRYSLDTITIIRASYAKWAAEISTPQYPVTFSFVDLNFEDVQDDAERHALNNIGTNFNLSDKSVDRLISAGREVLRTSKEFRGFLKSFPEQ